MGEKTGELGGLAINQIKLVRKQGELGGLAINRNKWAGV
jgi:hypothetical protein